MRTKKQMVLHHLKTHPVMGITSVEAFQLYNCIRLASAIESLRHDDGYEIATIMIKPDRGSNYARYVLKKGGKK